MAEDSVSVLDRSRTPTSNANFDFVKTPLMTLTHSSEYVVPKSMPQKSHSSSSSVPAESLGIASNDVFDVNAEIVIHESHLRSQTQITSGLEMAGIRRKGLAVTAITPSTKIDSSSCCASKENLFHSGSSSTNRASVYETKKRKRCTSLEKTMYRYSRGMKTFMPRSQTFALSLDASTHPGGASFALTAEVPPQKVSCIRLEVPDNIGYCVVRVG